jgi:hypothetical protein
VIIKNITAELLFWVIRKLAVLGYFKTIGSLLLQPLPQCLIFLELTTLNPPKNVFLMFTVKLSNVCFYRVGVDDGVVVVPRVAVVLEVRVGQVHLVAALAHVTAHHGQPRTVVVQLQNV